MVVKKFASEEKADPLVFSFYRDACCFPLLFACALIVERTLIFPRLRMLMVSQQPPSHAQATLKIIVLSFPHKVFVLLGFTGMFGNQVSCIKIYPCFNNYPSM